MLHSRSKHSKTKEKDNKNKYDLEKFLVSRDFTGAVTLLEFKRKVRDTDDHTLLWLAYSAFHLGDYPKSLALYNQILLDPAADPNVWLYKACCLFYLGQTEEAFEAASKGPVSRLQNRIMFHLSHKSNDENQLLQYHQKLSDQVEDQLSLASIHYLRSHFQNAADVYKLLLMKFRDYSALQVYLALCYYKLDYHEISMEILEPYLKINPESAIGINLKACNMFRIYDGKAAEDVLKQLVDLMATSSQNIENDLVRHNMVCFRSGENALKHLPPLIEFIPEARLNLVIYHLKNDSIMDAYNLVKDLEPSTPQEYILKAVVNASVGQAQDSQEHIRLAQQYFQLVGGSSSEQDTIPGRQCMASLYFLLKEFQDVLVYIQSIKEFMQQDESFLWNYAITLAAVTQYEEAQEIFLSITNETLTQDYIYLCWLSRVFIMNGNAQEAWELYLKMKTSPESFNLLNLIANECYRVGQFYFSAKAFDVLERLDGNPEYWAGKRGACCGVLQQVIAGREDKMKLKDIVQMLLNSNENDAEFIRQVIIQWCQSNEVDI